MMSPSAFVPLPGTRDCLAEGVKIGQGTPGWEKCDGVPARSSDQSTDGKAELAWRDSGLISNKIAGGAVLHSKISCGTRCPRIRCIQTALPSNPLHSNTLHSNPAGIAEDPEILAGV
jgi:hypothetical protein